MVIEGGRVFSVVLWVKRFDLLFGYRYTRSGKCEDVMDTPWKKGVYSCASRKRVCNGARRSV